MRIALKRIFRDLPFLILLIALPVISLLGYRAGQNIQTPPFGFVCEQNDADGIRLSRELSDSGFVQCRNEEDLRGKIMDAQLDCGIIIDENISRKLREGNPEKCILLITSPETLMPELCRAESVAALSVVYSPYITFRALNESIPLEAVQETYYGMVDSGALFRFELETVNGEAYADNSRSINLFTGSLAILILMISWIGICRPVRVHYDDMKLRLGRSTAFGRILLPEFLLRVLLLILAGLLSALLVSRTGMAGALIIYTAAVSLIGLGLILLLPETYVIILTVFISLLSLGLCPVFTDLAAFIPAAAKARYFLLPYYLWIL